MWVRGRRLGLVAGWTVLLFGASIPVAQTAAADTWDHVQSWGQRPSERSAPSVGTVDRSVYLFGGVKDDFSTSVYTYHNDLYRFHAPSKRWSAVIPSGPAPAPRAFAGAVGHSRRSELYVFGGGTYPAELFPLETFGDLWVYLERTNRWEEVVPANAGPVARSGPTMWIDGNLIYVFGGITATFEMRNDLWVYDITTNRWTELVPHGAAGSPSGRHAAMGGQEPSGWGSPWNTRLVVYGGEGMDSEGGFTILNDTWEFDIAQGTWSDTTPDSDPISPARNYAAAAVIGQSLYLQGGDIPGGSGGCGAPFAQNTTNEIWRFDIAASTWTQATPVGGPVPALKRHAAAAVGRTIYLFAGYDFVCEDDGDPGQVWNTEVYSYEPD